MATFTLLLLFGIYHLLAAIFLLGPKRWRVYWGRKMYKMNPSVIENENPVSVYLGGQLGLVYFCIFVACFFALIADKNFQKVLCLFFALLSLIRFIFAVVRSELIQESFSQPKSEIIKKASINFIFFVIFIYFSVPGSV